MYNLRQSPEYIGALKKAIQDMTDQSLDHVELEIPKTQIKFLISESNTDFAKEKKQKSGSFLHQYEEGNKVYWVFRK